METKAEEKAVTIRDSAKAVIIEDGKILLQCCMNKEYGLEYFELPGGGQNPQEKMEDAVVRECLEETGYHIEVLRFFALCEEIITVEDFHRAYPDYVHRVFHIFLCKIKDTPCQEHSEEDANQVDVRWFPLEAVSDLRLRPTNLRSALLPLFKSGEAGYLGTSILEHFEK